MESVLKFLPNILKRGKKASFIVHSIDDVDLDTLRKGVDDGLVKNILIIQDKMPRRMRDEEFFLRTEEWEKDEQEYIEKTRGCFIIRDQLSGSEEDFVSMMEDYVKYYPVVFISPEDESDEFYRSSLSGWKEYTTKLGVTIFANKNRKNFEHFTVDFGKILEEEDVKPVVSTYLKENSKGDKIVEEVFLRGKEFSDAKPEPITRKKPKQEEDWSLFEGLPRPSMEPDHSSETWVKEFYLYLRDLVSRIVPPGKEKLVDIVVNKRTINDVWLDVFTSMYSNMNPGKNYEVYEAVGDSVVKYVFYVYLYERFAPNIDKDQLNDLKTKFLSKGWQSIAGEKMGLSDWVIIPKELKNHPAIKEDMQEAFCGALEVILNKAAPSRGYATIIILHMFHKIFKDYNFDLSEKLTPKVSQLIQWYPMIAKAKRDEKVVIKQPRSVDRKEWKKVTKEFEDVMRKHGILMDIAENAGTVETGVRYEEDVRKDGTAEYRVYLNDAGYEVLKQRGFPVDKIKNKLLAEAKASTLDQASTLAKTRAMEKLESIGLTQEWREKQKIKKNTKDLTGIKEALIKAKSENRNIVDILPAKPTQKLSYSVYQLYGITKEEEKIPLETLVVSTGGANKVQINAYQELVDKYLMSDDESEEED